MQARHPAALSGVVLPPNSPADAQGLGLASGCDHGEMAVVAAALGAGPVLDRAARRRPARRS